MPITISAPIQQQKLAKQVQPLKQVQPPSQLKQQRVAMAPQQKTIVTDVTDALLGLLESQQDVVLYGDLIPIIYHILHTDAKKMRSYAAYRGMGTKLKKAACKGLEPPVEVAPFAKSLRPPVRSARIALALMLTGGQVDRVGLLKGQLAFQTFDIAQLVDSVMAVYRTVVSRSSLVELAEGFYQLADGLQHDAHAERNAAQSSVIEFTAAMKRVGLV